MKKIIIFGLSGSIGVQTLDIINNHLDEFEIVGVSVGKNTTLLKEFLNKYQPKAIYSIEKDTSIDDSNLDYYHGDNGLVELLNNTEYDLLINALVGYVGFLPTLVSISKGKDVALANKESLVVGGQVILNEMQKTNAKLYPIDSEHSAIYQALANKRYEDINRLIITASGGSFRDKSREEIKYAKKEDALKHPTWSMGNKITIDSATMMNKGFEIIEAHYLFNIDYDKIDVLLHKESIVHSMVEFNDASIIAQLSEPDMRLPINYALFAPKHLNYANKKRLDLINKTLHFESLDENRYPLIEIAKMVGKMGGNLPAVLNGANDTAVSLFLEDKIPFYMIEELIILAIKNAKYIKDVEVKDIEEAYNYAKEFVNEYIKKDEDIR